MFETGPYLRLYYGASGDMPAHGVQGLAGEYPMLVCNWGGAYLSWCQYSDCKPIVRIEL